MEEDEKEEKEGIKDIGMELEAMKRENKELREELNDKNKEMAKLKQKIKWWESEESLRKEKEKAVQLEIEKEQRNAELLSVGSRSGRSASEMISYNSQRTGKRISSKKGEYGIENGSLSPWDPYGRGKTHISVESSHGSIPPAFSPSEVDVISNFEEKERVLTREYMGLLVGSRNDLQTIKEELASKKREIDNLRGTLDEANSKNKRYFERLQKQENEMGQMEGRIKVKEEALTNTNHLFAKSEKEYKEELRKSKDAMEQLKIGWEKERKELAETIKTREYTMVQEIEGLRSNNAWYAGKYPKLVEENRGLNERLDEKSEKMEKMEETYKKRVNKLEARNSFSSSSDDANWAPKLEKALEETRELLDESNAKVEELQSRVNEKDKKLREKEELKLKEIESKESEIDDLRGTLKELNSENEQYFQSLQKQENEMEELKERVKVREEELTNTIDLLAIVRETAEKQSKELESAVKSEKQMHKEELRKAKDTMEQLEIGWEREKKELVGTIETREYTKLQQFDRIRSDNAWYAENYPKVVEENRGLDELLRKTKAKYEKSKAHGKKRAKELKSQLKSLEEERGDMARLEKLEMINKEKDRRLEDAQKLIEKVEGSEKEWKARLEKAETKIEKLEMEKASEMERLRAQNERLMEKSRSGKSSRTSSTSSSKTHGGRRRKKNHRSRDPATRLIHEV